ncbi:MAG: hypothetical protein ACXAC5_12830 [Promethearchaeota archaeon]|jgi:hypothetical protein
MIVIAMLGLLGYSGGISFVKAGIHANNSVESSDKGEEPELIPVDLDEGLIWSGDWYRFHVWGDVKNRTTYNRLDENSLLNRDDFFDVPRFENLTELKLKLDGDIADQLGLFVRGRFDVEFIKSEDESDLDYSDTLDQAFVTYEFGEEPITFLSLGKQRIRWGTGIFWNPVDTFNPRQDLQDIERIEEGKNAFRGDMAFGSSSVTGVLVPNSDDTSFYLHNYSLEEGRTLITGKFYTFIWNTDLTFYVSDKEMEDVRWGASFSTVIWDIQLFGEGVFWQGESERVYVRPTSDRTPTFDPIGNTQFTLPAEFDRSKREDSYYKFVVGFQYTFSNDLTLIGEYYYRGDGFDEDDWDNYIEFLRYAGGSYQDDVDSTALAKERNPLLEIPSFPPSQSLLADGNDLYEFADIRRNYFHLSATRPYVADKYDLSADLIVSLDDLLEGRGGSLFLRPLVAYVAIPDWRFSLYSQLYIGAGDTEFGILPYDYSLFADIRYFF